MEDFSDVSTALILSENIVGDELIQTCNARLIWEYVESKQQFGNWIQNRIEKYGFIEGQDYLLNKVIKQLPSGSKTLIEYHCTLSMGKELGMLENNEKGKRIRLYFLHCEKIANGSMAVMSPIEMLAKQAQNMVMLEKAQKVLAFKQQQQGEALLTLAKEVNAQNKDTNYRSIIGYAKMKGISAMPNKEAVKLGTAASKYCKANDIKMDDTFHEKYNSVHIYPIDVLDIIFKHYGYNV